MTGILLAEHAPPDGRILVLGAGGGLELQDDGRGPPRLDFRGVDPAKEMLLQAARAIGPLMDRVTLFHGYVVDAPAGPFYGATCLLTLLFLDASERERTLREIHRRLTPDAPFEAAHSSFPQDDQRPRWLSRCEAYAVALGADREMAEKARAAVAASLDTLGPEQDEDILRLGGSRDVVELFAAFTWPGWIGRASEDRDRSAGGENPA